MNEHYNNFVDKTKSYLIGTKYKVVSQDSNFEIGEEVFIKDMTISGNDHIYLISNGVHESFYFDNTIVERFAQI